MKLNTYQKVAILTIVATLILIFVGGLVRASGAGLGCPDWPKCFGLWIPPTNVAELPSAFSPEQFNVVKTWTEYINRLIGVLIGLLITITMFLSFSYRKSTPSVMVSSVSAFILVVFQGWLGGMVVRSGLTEWIITIHMLVAMIIVGLLLYGAFNSISGQIHLRLAPTAKVFIARWSLVLLLVTVMQLVLGTQVREAIDVISKMTPPVERVDWLAGVGNLDGVHRSFSWLVLLASVYLSWFVYRHSVSGYFRKLVYTIFGMIAGQIFVGIVLAYGGMPPSFQVLHLFGSALLISFILLLVFSSRSAQIQQ